MDKRKILINKPSRKFWITNILGWCFIALVNTLFQYLRMNFDFERALFGIIPMAWGFVITSALRYYWGMVDTYSFKAKKIIISLIPQSIIATALIVSTGIGTILLFRGPEGSTEVLLLNNFLSLYPIILLWIAFYFLFIFYVSSRDKEIANLRLINSLQSARLDNLKTQLNPHFLFNALNNIRSLVREDSEKARAMISSLTDILRYSLSARSEHTVMLKNEIAFLNEYLLLERLHMEERLKYEISIDPDCENALVPPMIIQLFAENAIKHGLGKLKDGGSIKIDVTKIKNKLNIKVSNTGTIGEADSGDGVGLANIRDRLFLLYGNEAVLSLNQEGEFVSALINMPLEVKQ